MNTHHPLQPIVNALPMSREARIVAASILKLAMEFDRAHLRDGVLGVGIPVGHPHWPFINQMDIRHELSCAGRGLGVEAVDLFPVWGEVDDGEA